MSAITQGRQDLARWRASVPDNFFTCDANLRRVLPLYDAGYANYEAELAAFGRAVAAVIDPAATVNDRPHNHPRLDAWDGIGQRTESIEFHPSYHDAGRPAYEAGILALSAEPGHAVQQSALFYLLTQAGEMGHACPIVCTLGLIRALQAKGSPELQAAFLPPLLARDYDRKQTASQFLTEVQGGSDVGANAVEARPGEDQPGAWLLRGEKWFCSVANADQMLVTARPADAADGTRGLGTFLVPRHLPGGSLNAFHIRRLKTKFGTRTMASGEIDFEDAVAYPIGQIDEGFKIVVELVLNTSRWTNALGSTGLLRRAYVEAWTFAQQRQAFGAAIGRYPLVLEGAGRPSPAGQHQQVRHLGAGQPGHPPGAGDHGRQRRDRGLQRRPPTLSRCARLRKLGGQPQRALPASSAGYAALWSAPAAPGVSGWAAGRRDPAGAGRAAGSDCWPDGAWAAAAGAGAGRFP